MWVSGGGGVGGGVLYLVAYVLCEGALAMELVDLLLPESFQLLQFFVLGQVPQLHR